jgi:uncharacterized membrane protein
VNSPLRIIGILLIVLGLVALAYQGITYTKSEKVLEVGPITATKETKKTIPLPPVLGGVALLGGVVLLVASSSRPVGLEVGSEHNGVFGSRDGSTPAPATGPRTRGRE